MYTGIECIKNGFAYDKRYRYESMQIDRPQVIVFSNHFPEISAMSKDRWKIYRITVPDNDISKTDLIYIPPEDYNIEQSVNKSSLSFTLNKERNKATQYSKVASELLSNETFKSRSDLIDAVKLNVQKTKKRKVIIEETI